jgi:hypothetical protein
MQKVEGSNPFSRFLGSPLTERVFAFQGLVGAMADENFKSLAAQTDLRDWRSSTLLMELSRQRR